MGQDGLEVFGLGAGAALQVAPPVAALAALIAVQGALWPAPALAMLPILAFSGRNKRVRDWDQAAIRGSMTWLLLGTMLDVAEDDVDDAGRLTDDPDDPVAAQAHLYSYLGWLLEAAVAAAMAAVPNGGNPPKPR